MQNNAPWPCSAIKRLLDFIFAALWLMLLWPVMAVIALLVYFQLGSPVFFRQERPGKNGDIFSLIKFRSLRGTEADNRDPETKHAPTAFFRFLRASGLDELPEFWNILKGDMSFVGPRPLLVRYLDRYNAEQHRRHAVRPGLTGLAQVKGRNALDWEERLAWDVRYVCEATLKMDLQILWQTLRLIGSGEGSAEPEEFFGTAHTHE